MPAPRYQRKPRETESLPSIPSTTPPPVPAQQVRAQRDIGFDVQRQPQRQNLFQQLLAKISGPVYPGPSISERIFGDTSIYSGPSLLDRFAGGASAAPVTQADLPQAGLAQAAVPGLGGGPAARIARRGGPQQLEGRRFFTIVSAITRGVRPPLITFEAQQYLGYSHDDMKDRLGYELTAGGWVRRPVTGTVVDAYLGGAGTGDGVVDFTLPSLPTYGGGSQRLSRSGLINWRI